MHLVLLDYTLPSVGDHLDEVSLDRTITTLYSW